MPKFMMILNEIPADIDAICQVLERLYGAEIDVQISAILSTESPECWLALGKIFDEKASEPEVTEISIKEELDRR